MSRERYVDPKAADLEAEHQFIQSTSRSARRVSMQRGDSWLVRFLPAEMGPRKHWYARIAKHWVNQKPIVCPKFTGPDYGGDPDAYCPVCDMVATLDNSQSDAVRDAAFRARANPQWITHCLVIEKSSGHASLAIPSSEMVLPYAFELYKNTFEELSAFYRNNTRKNNPLSVLDFVLGCDFWASKTAKGIRLDKQDPQPILDGLPEDPNADPRIVKIMDLIQTPRVQIPDNDKLEEAADKLEDFATRGASGGGGRGRGRGPDRGDDHDDDRHERGGRGSRGYDDDERGGTAARGGYDDEPPPRARGRSPRVAEDPDDDQIPGAEAPARSARAQVEPPARGARNVPQREERSVQEPEPPARGRVSRQEADPERGNAEPADAQGGEDGGGQAAQAEGGDDGEETVPIHRSVTRQPAPTPTRGAVQVPRAGTTTSRISPEERAAGRPNANATAAANSRGAVRSRSDGGARIDENEELPEERTERVPPARTPIRDVEDEPPPTVARAGGTAQPERMAAVRDKINKANLGRRNE